ncbi:thermonuclease family protein [Salinarimonas ramus]|uniref:Nuclease n=1 Tax=Salinarimonas ramus TaxID=690164 RepID=A0A917QA83_9HYPH|nr:thermonuclease family protein [Salinarimonas ramus]GGK35820.1 nuclease [Salinarimonas ramus]
MRPDVPRSPHALVRVIFVLVALASAPAAALDCAAPPVSDRIVAIPARGEVLLASGATLRLAGVRLADAGASGATARAALDRLIGSAVTVRIANAEPDRWGRLAGSVTLAPGEGSGLDLAEDLVSRGLAWVDPGPDGVVCRPDLLDIEAGARRDGRGLWADSAERVLDAQETEALAAREGRFAVVEGVVRRVGERERRTYLDFGWSWTSGFTAIVPDEVRTALEAKGLDAEALEGRRMRVRGIIEVWRGPALRVGAAEAIEILPMTSAQPRRPLP